MNDDDAPPFAHYTDISVRDYSTLMKMINTHRERTVQLLGSDDGTSPVAPRVRNDADAYGTWYYTVRDSIPQLERLDARYDETKREITQLQNDIAAMTCEQNRQQRAVTKTLKISLPATVLGVSAIVGWPSVWWLYLLTSIAAATSIIMISRSVRSSMATDDARGRAEVENRLDNAKQTVHNIIEARDVVRREVHASAPEFAAYEITHR